ncbi:Ppx/GppA family phosphatase [Croceibacterium sp. LX-88]|uniref:Ppx/GppA family phosphatase n=1 Tax=Croceibacterium selenioxidans TaxID=2838833 RepID=A0ABS5W6P8_9SPHN|nr:Ppx/GppA family phosphatase [Croceibacterium selenioxidans]MBT2135344.1 Ppx/GppA family phosphatase [Croceibacterium selenioxidans]
MKELLRSDAFRLDRGAPDRAVVDIGSNTVRLVVYSGSQRVPDVWFNEKVGARLGRELNDTGRIPDRAAQLALAGLRRFAAILHDLDVKWVEVVGTAAVREAVNAEPFLAEVREIGLEPRVLTGEEEAQASAWGVIGAFPDAHGVVADLGGGSLELVSVENGRSHHGESLPLGTLRLSGLREKGPLAFKRAVHKAFEKAGWAAAHPGPLYMVGGTWRAFATYTMRSTLHPLSDPHTFELDVAEADRIAKKLVRSDPRILMETARLSSMRANALPDAAAIMRAMLAELQPTHLVFSSWGLREGLLHQRLSPEIRRKDPLLEGISYFGAPRASSAPLAAAIAAWTAGAVRQDGKPEAERLRLAATMLSLSAVRLEPNLRVRHSLDWALHKRWIGVDMAGRAQIAAALLGACGKQIITPDLLRLAPEETLRRAIGWGLATRLCLRLGGGVPPSPTASSLTLSDGTLTLRLANSLCDLTSPAIEQDLRVLAEWIGADPALKLMTAA